jgi:hypothetical protein
MWLPAERSIPMGLVYLICGGRGLLCPFPDIWRWVARLYILFFTRLKRLESRRIGASIRIPLGGSAG